MQINGRSILSSAEGILRDRKQERGPEASVSGIEAAGPRESGLDTLQQGVLESRLLRLQSSLGDIQRDYSREQARFSYLNSNPAEISADLRFGDQPLFPELARGIDPQTLRPEVQGAMERLIRALKSVQVEMENLNALNFGEPVAGSRPNAQALVDRGGLKELDPERVARLTRP
ncbi:MAG: hypothetical protein K1X75_04600 [Leptospirales bacterium]|nr:hypothetical protein [Leptospirales bacterium]